MLGAHVAVPFFTPYMLRTLRLDYQWFTLLTSMSILSKAATFPLWHRLARRVGLRPVLVASGIGIATVPGLWALTPARGPLLLVHVLGGASWAGFEYASFQLLLQASLADCRIEFLALSQLLSGGAQLIGAVLGGQLLDRLGFDYARIFLISSLMRGAALLVLIRKIALPTRLPALMTRLLSVRPTAGGVQQPIGKSHDERG
jgi:MFS family permease